MDNQGRDRESTRVREDVEKLEPSAVGCSLCGHSVAAPHKIEHRITM